MTHVATKLLALLMYAGNNVPVCLSTADAAHYSILPFVASPLDGGKGTPISSDCAVLYANRVIFMTCTDVAAGRRVCTVR